MYDAGARCRSRPYILIYMIVLQFWNSCSDFGSTALLSGFLVAQIDRYTQHSGHVWQNYAPSRPQDGPEMAPRWPREAQDCPKIVPGTYRVEENYATEACLQAQAPEERKYRESMPWCPER